MPNEQAAEPEEIRDNRVDYTGSVPSRRMPVLDDSALTAPQRRLWDAVAGSARADTAIREAGQLTGPFDVLLRSPEIGEAVSALGERLRFEASLDKHELELVIVTVAGHWRARYSWLRHDLYARRAGIPEEALAIIADGGEPSFDSAADRAIFAFTRSLVSTGNASDELYSQTLALVGERKLVDIVTLAGYYSMSSFILNAFDVPLPLGERVPWDNPSS